MTEIDRRIDIVKAGFADHWLPQEDTWFAWYPVRLGALGTGELVWFRYVRRDMCLGVTNYFSLKEKRHDREDQGEDIALAKSTVDTFSENMSAVFDRESAKRAREDDVEAKSRR